MKNWNALSRDISAPPSRQHNQVIGPEQTKDTNKSKIKKQKKKKEKKKKRKTNAFHSRRGGAHSRQTNAVSHHVCHNRTSAMSEASEVTASSESAAASSTTDENSRTTVEKTKTNSAPVAAGSVDTANADSDSNTNLESTNPKSEEGDGGTSNFDLLMGGVDPSALAVPVLPKSESEAASGSGCGGGGGDEKNDKLAAAKERQEERRKAKQEKRDQIKKQTTCPALQRQLDQWSAAVQAAMRLKSGSKARKDAIHAFW